MSSLMVSLRLFKCFFKLQAIFVHRYRRTCIFFQSKTPPITRHTNQDRRQWSLKKERVNISPLFPFHFIPRHLKNRTKEELLMPLHSQHNFLSTSKKKMSWSSEMMKHRFGKTSIDFIQNRSYLKIINFFNYHSPTHAKKAYILLEAPLMLLMFLIHSGTSSVSSVCHRRDFCSWRNGRLIWSVSKSPV